MQMIMMVLSSGTADSQLHSTPLQHDPTKHHRVLRQHWASSIVNRWHITSQRSTCRCIWTTAAATTTVIWYATKIATSQQQQQQQEELSSVQYVSSRLTVWIVEAVVRGAS
jgi:hypothetical protein